MPVGETEAKTDADTSWRRSPSSEGEDACHFQYKEIGSSEVLAANGLSEVLQGRSVRVGTHSVNLYTAKSRADDLDPDDLGLHIWPGTHVMAYLLLDLERKGQLLGRSLLDVGCGTGFIGILARLAGCGATVLSDREEKVLSATRINLEANPQATNGSGGGSAIVKVLSWGKNAIDETGKGVYSLVLLSEVLYVAQPRCVPWSLDDEDVAALALLTKEKLAPDGEAWVTYGNREEGGGEQFRAAAEAVGLVFAEVPVGDIVPEEVLFSRGAHAIRRVRVFRLVHAT